MSTYKIELLIDGDWEEIDIVISDFTKSEILYNNLKPADTTCSFTIPADTTLYNTLRTYGPDLPVRITKDDDPYFYGYIRKTFSVSKTQKLQHMKVECVSPSYLLKRKVGYDLYYTNITVTQLLTNLLTVAGITSYTLPTIAYKIPGFSCVAGKGETYHAYIEGLLFEYGYVFYFNESGAFTTTTLLPASLTPVGLFNGSNCRKVITQTKKEEEKEQVSVQWTGTKTLINAIVFSDTTGAGGGSKCNIELQPSGYLGDKQEWYAELVSEEGDILSVDAVTLDIIKDSDIEVLTFTKSGNRVLISVKNNNATFTRFIHKFDIIADTVVVAKDENLSIVIKNPNTEKIENIQTKYVYDKDVGDALANLLAWYYRYSDFSYSLQSYNNYDLGDVVTVSDTGIGTNTARIIQKKTDEQSGLITYVLDAVDEFTPDTVENEYTTVQPPSSYIPETVIYEMNVSTPLLNVFSDDVFQPDPLVVTLEKRSGLTPSESYDGIIKVKVNGTVEYTTPTPTHSLSITVDNWNTLGFTTPISEIENIDVLFYDVSGTVLLQTYPIAAVQIQVITEEVVVNLPKYIGTFLDDFPTVYKAGDWFILYAEDDDPIERGIYRVDANLDFVKVTGATSDDTQYVLSVMPDLLTITSSGIYGTIEDYGAITYLANLASNSVFTEALRVGSDNFDTTIIEGGKIKTELIDTGTILGENATFTGTIMSQNGLFKGSIEAGPLLLNVSQPGTAQTFTTTSKTPKVFVDEIIAAGIAAGKYNATGTYNSTAIGAIEIYLQATGTRTYVQTKNTSYWSKLSNNCQYGEWAQRRDCVWYGYISKKAATVTFYNSTGGVIAAVTNYFWASSTDWALQSDTLSSYRQCSFGPFTRTAPGAIAEGVDATPTLTTGSVSMTSGTFTYRLTNLPAYSASLPAGTVYLSASGSNYILMVKG